MNFSCPNIKFGDKVLEWIKGGIVGRCIYRIQTFAGAVFLGTPIAALDEVALKLGAEGEGIDGAAALAQITPALEKRIPQLTTLKNADNVALTGISLFQEESVTVVSIGVKITGNNQVGNVKIDGIGLSVRVNRADKPL